MTLLDRRYGLPLATLFACLVGLAALAAPARAQQRIGVCIPPPASSAIFELTVRELGEANVLRACADDGQPLDAAAAASFAAREDLTVIVWLDTTAPDHATSTMLRARNVATSSEQSMRIDMPPATIDRRAAVQAITALIRMVSQPAQAPPPAAASTSVSPPAPVAPDAATPPTPSSPGATTSTVGTSAQNENQVPVVAGPAAAPPAAPQDVATASTPHADTAAPPRAPARDSARRRRVRPEENLPLDWAILFSLGTRSLNGAGHLTYGFGVRGAVPAGRHFAIGAGVRFTHSPSADLWQIHANLPDIALVLRSVSNGVELRLGARPLLTLNHGDPTAAHGGMSLGAGVTLEASVNLPLTAHTRLNVGGLADFSWAVVRGSGTLHVIQFFTAFAFDL